MNTKLLSLKSLSLAVLLCAVTAAQAVVLSATDGSTTRTVTLEDTMTTTFLGFVSSNPLTSVQLSGGAEHWPTANNLTPAALPEPDTYAMLLLGLFAMGWLVNQRDG